MAKGNFYHPEIERISRKALRDLQNERLRWQVRRCLAKSEFYGEKFKKAGLKASHIKTGWPWIAPASRWLSLMDRTPTCARRIPRRR